MRDIIEKHIIDLTNKGLLDIRNCNTEFDKLKKLYEINEIPTDTLIDLLEKENYNLTQDNLNELADLFRNNKTPMSEEDITRNISNIKSNWNI